MKLFSFVIFAIIFSSMLVSAEEPMKPTPALLSRGKIVYAQNCVVCHGDKGMGDGPGGLGLKPKPRNFVSDNFKKGTSPAQIFDTITKGVKGSQMVSYSYLPEQDRWALAFYISNLRKTKGK